MNPKQINKIDQKFDNRQFGNILDTMSKVKLVKTSYLNGSSSKNGPEITPIDVPKTVSIPTPDNNTGPGFLSPNKIDVAVLGELPEDIRLEIESTLRKTGHLKKSKPTAAAPVPRIVDPVENVATDSLNTVSNKNNGVYIPDILSPSQLDKSVLQALPVDMREEILEEAKDAKRRKLSNTKRPF